MLFVYKRMTGNEISKSDHVQSMARSVVYSFLVSKDMLLIKRILYLKTPSSNMPVMKATSMIATNRMPVL